MRDDVRRDLDRQRPFVPLMATMVGCELGPHLFKEAPPDEDMRENSDLVILAARDIRVACRVRFDHRWPSEVTLRAWRKGCAETEIHKVLKGFGHALFYGLGIEGDKPTFKQWCMISLNTFRKTLAGFDLAHGDDGIEGFVDFSRGRGFRRTRPKPNNDGKTGFLIFDLRDMVRIPGLIMTCIPSLPSVPPPRRRRFSAGQQPDLFGD